MWEWARRLWESLRRRPRRPRKPKRPRRPQRPRGDRDGPDLPGRGAGSPGRIGGSRPPRFRDLEGLEGRDDLTPEEQDHLDQLRIRRRRSAGGRVRPLPPPPPPRPLDLTPGQYVEVDPRRIRSTRHGLSERRLDHQKNATPQQRAEYDRRRPITVDQDGVLQDGNHRVRADIDANRGRVRVRVVPGRTSGPTTPVGDLPLHN